MTKRDGDRDAVARDVRSLCSRTRYVRRRGRDMFSGCLPSNAICRACGNPHARREKRPKAKRTEEAVFLKPQNGAEAPFCSIIIPEVLCRAFLTAPARWLRATPPRKRAFPSFPSYTVFSVIPNLSDSAETRASTAGWISVLASVRSSEEKAKRRVTDSPFSPS